MVYMLKNEVVIQKNQLPRPAVSDDDCVAASGKQIFLPIMANQTKGYPLTTIDPTIQGLYSDTLYPATIRVGDFNIDGYPDLLFTVRGLEETATLLCLSSDQTTTLDHCRKVGGNSILGAFFDLDEDGYGTTLRMIGSWTL